jgi:hypothetical protein
MKTTSPRAHKASVVCALACSSILVARGAFGQAEQPSAAPSLPATGQTKPYPADRAGDHTGAVSVPDDGQVQAGAALRYRDNGDGTITDLNTGLMWEKKCAACGDLHDLQGRYRWSGDGKAETIWDWLGRVNSEGEHGFAGHSDWRMPNVRELVSIVDYGALLPAVGSEFRGERCAHACTDVTEAGCSCTDDGEYWSSTTFADFPAHALVVYFGMGLVNDRVKTGLHYVRAVRAGGLPATGQTTSYRSATTGASGAMTAVPDDGRLRAGRPPAFRDNGDGTVTDLGTGLMWEKKCDGCGGLHDAGLDLRWSGDGDPTVWDWQARVNAEGRGGFAGHSDWRVPNVKELQSIVDYERFNPAVSRTFDGDRCGRGCTDLGKPQCSCTGMSAYWSSTTLAGRPNDAVVVAFHLGLIETRAKNAFARVRAVRGAITNAADAPR